MNGMAVSTLTPTILSELAEQLQGSLFTDTVMRTLYATDASAYREMPLESPFLRRLKIFKR